MAGHSKWKNIQHRKNRQDAARGKTFTKISREIFVAARQGGGDPSANQRLRLAVSKAREANMPNDNIERTIKKALGALDGVTYEEITYEGYGPAGVAVLVEVLTDNRNRTAADVRHIFSKHGGNLGASGCVAWMFARKGTLVVNRADTTLDEDHLLMLALEAGAEDFAAEEETYDVTTAPEQFEQVKEALSEEGVTFARAEIAMEPENTVTLSGDDATKMLKLIDALEDNDDVQNVYANFELDEEALQQHSAN
ncbi:YebC/PmpR family DNA-binding transcriptional regulator [Numidum massiliense]|uniref:YebC/PmpR family DNA-binding transcriptional regulator n=1 Tax=Numidum massiliense TaxID=1522315 RepID=UPI0006D52AA2|nr:YebC/PmpR family DNA-binding transcriptional regulator [Numidum massiliense]